MQKKFRVWILKLAKDKCVENLSLTVWKFDSSMKGLKRLLLNKFCIIKTNYYSHSSKLSPWFIITSSKSPHSARFRGSN